VGRDDAPMAKPKPEKKPAAAPAPTRVLPMELQVGDRLVEAARTSMLVSGGWINLPPRRTGPGAPTSGSR